MCPSLSRFHHHHHHHHLFFQIIRHEGIPALYRGISAIVAAAIPSHAVYFATYEAVKEKLGGNAGGHRPIESALAGAAAIIAHDAVVTPLDVVKQRMQVYHSPHRSMISCARTILRHEGAHVFYASYPVTVAMNVPFMSMHFASYESLKLIFEDALPERFHTLAHLSAGAGAGAVGAFVSNPFDVVKTVRCVCVCVCVCVFTLVLNWTCIQRIQVEGDLSGIRRVVQGILTHEGKGAFFKGVTARVLYHMPSAAICWSTYEAFKMWLA